MFQGSGRYLLVGIALFASAVLLGGLLVSRAGDGPETELPKTPIPVQQGQPPSIPTAPPLGETSFPTAEEAAANLPPGIRDATQAILDGSADEIAALVAWDTHSCSDFEGLRGGGLFPSCSREGLADGTLVRAIRTASHMATLSSEREFDALLDILLTENLLRLDLVGLEPDGSYLLAFHLEEARTFPEEFFRGDSPIEWLYVWLFPGEDQPIVMLDPTSTPDPVRFWLGRHQHEYAGILGVSEELKAVDESYREEFQRRVEEMRPTVEAIWTAAANEQ